MKDVHLPEKVLVTKFGVMWKTACLKLKVNAEKDELSDNPEKITCQVCLDSKFYQEVLKKDEKQI